MTHIIYMAAGNSRRFGCNKLLSEWKGKPLYRHTLDRLLDILKSGQYELSLTVVTQYAELEDQVQSLIANLKNAAVLLNPGSAEGASNTIKAGLESVRLRFGEDGATMFVVADQPNLTERTILRMLEQSGKTAEILSLAYRGKPGNPCVFPKRLIPELFRLQGDEGGRSIAKKHTIHYIEAECELELEDVDYPAG